MPMITLPENCSVTNIDNVYALFKEVYQAGTTIELDCSAIEHADSSFIQLILALAKTNVTLTYHNISPALHELYTTYNLSVDV